MGRDRLRSELGNIARVRNVLVRHPSDAMTALGWLAGSDGQMFRSGTPWWPRRAIRYVERALPRNATVFEYGGGGSTMWLERLGASVTTVEHDERWAEELRGATNAERTTILFEPPRRAGALRSDAAEGYFDDYVRAVATYGPDGLDLLIVDGRCRVACVLEGKSSVRPGGLLLLDDSHRPKYQAAMDLMGDWSVHHVVGIKIGSREVCRTSIWRRPTT